LVAGLITNIRQSINTMICLFWNDYGFIVMFNVFVQHRTMTIWFQGTMFNVANAIPIKVLRDLHTIVGDNMMRDVGFLHIHNWRLVGQNHCIGHFRMKEVHPTMWVWICFWPKWNICLAFCWSKHFFTFQVQYSNKKTKAWSVRWKHIKVVKFQWIIVPF